MHLKNFFEELTIKYGDRLFSKYPEMKLFIEVFFLFRANETVYFVRTL